MTDSEINLVLNETLGFSQKLSHDDAQLLLDKLIEFQHKEGSTDVSLNHFRGLAVESTGNSIRFAFFQRDQASHTLHWHNLKQQEIQSAITKLRNGLGKVQAQ